MHVTFLPGLKGYPIDLLAILQQSGSSNTFGYIIKIYETSHNPGIWHTFQIQISPTVLISHFVKYHLKQVLHHHICTYFGGTLSIWANIESSLYVLDFEYAQFLKFLNGFIGIIMFTSCNFWDISKQSSLKPFQH